jgi:glycosyltransferase involved in cell wall biosynthesis
LFKYCENSNCKNIDILIDIFNELDINLNFQFNIICSVKQKVFYFNLLQKYNNIISKKKIVFYPDCSDLIKEYILEQSDYYIHATGIRNLKDSFPSEEEHFGISVIESLSKKCIPIVANRGYPPYLIKHNENGYIFDNINELKLILSDILNNENLFIENLKNVYEKNLDIAKRFNNLDIYNSNILKILFNA